MTVYNEDINAMRSALGVALEDFRRMWKPGATEEEFRKLAVAVVKDTEWNKKHNWHNVELYERVRKRLRWF